METFSLKQGINKKKFRKETKQHVLKLYNHIKEHASNQPN